MTDPKTRRFRFRAYDEEGHLGSCHFVCIGGRIVFSHFTRDAGDGVTEKQAVEGGVDVVFPYAASESKL